MIFKAKPTGEIFNLTMTVDPRFEYVEKISGVISWYIMESQDNISSICFKLKKKESDQVI